MKRFFALLIALSVFLGALCSCNVTSNGGTDKGETYTVTFVTNGGSAVNPIAKAANAALSAPNAPTKDGYVFDGWYSDEDCTQLFVFSTMPAHDLTLYAKWHAVDDGTGDSGTGDSGTGDSGTGDSGTGDGGTGDSGTGDGGTGDSGTGDSGTGDGGTGDSGTGDGGTGDSGTGDGGTGDGGTGDSGTGDGGTGDSDTGDRGEDGSWEAVDFKGQTVNVSISVNQCDACMFPAADIYTKGPDVASTNEVARAVLARNKKAEDTLGIKINYIPTNIGCDKILEDVRAIMMAPSTQDSPDVYNNDIYGLSRAMVNGCLWNVKNPGEGIKNYFDFSKDGWYEEFIKGCTFDQDQYYIFAGDYFVDMIRMAWVVCVNNNILNASIGKTEYSDADGFYKQVENGNWDLDALIQLAEEIVDDGNVGGRDPVVGLVINEATAALISASSQVTLFYQDKEDGYKPKMMQDITDYQKVSNQYMRLKKSRAVYMLTGTDSIIEGSACFLNGNVAFAYSFMGEFESGAFRSFDESKGLVPIPKWDMSAQEEYRTPVYDRAELGCILNTAKAYSAASALMQFLAEESGEVIYAYYEKGMKFKFNDDKNTRTMMDIVRGSVDSPFSWQAGPMCLDLYTGYPSLMGISLEKNSTNVSTFVAEKDAYRDCLESMLQIFEAMK